METCHFLEWYPCQSDELKIFCLQLAILRKFWAGHKNAVQVCMNWFLEVSALLLETLEAWVTALTAFKWCTLGRAESHSNPAPPVALKPTVPSGEGERRGRMGRLPPPSSLHSSDSKTWDPSNTGQIISPWYKDKQQNQILYLLLNP